MKLKKKYERTQLTVDFQISEKRHLKAFFFSKMLHWCLARISHKTSLDNSLRSQPSRKTKGTKKLSRNL